MIGMGTIINSAFVLVGGLLGFLFGKALKDSYQDIMVKACGLSTIFIGASGTFKQMLTVTGGALGTIEASKITAGAADDMFLEIAGTKGAIRWSLMNPNYLEYYDNTQPEVPLGGMRGYNKIECVGRYPAPGGVFLPSKNAVGWDRGHIHCYYSFLDSVVHGKAVHPSIQEGTQLQLLMDALASSAGDRAWKKVERL